MSAADQLALFEPEAGDAARLAAGYIKEAERYAVSADRFELLAMPGLAAQAERAMVDAIQSASVLAMYLDLLYVAGEGVA